MSEQPNESFRSSGKRLFSFLMILLVLSLGIAIGTLISNRVDATGPGDSQLEMQTGGKPVAGGAVLALSQAFEDVSSRVEPCVVNINTEELVTPGQDQEGPMGDIFRFFPQPFQMEPQMRKSLGSGVIVDPKGYIITNDHVVSGATRIKVSVPGGEEYTAKVIGTDPVSDIAVIKIDGKKDFPFAKIGNSRDMKVGDWVIAIGSPFGLEQTVTAGIISTTGRTFENGGGPSEYSFLNDYLQTDAAINRGNSGGPLVNMNAEVVGINSFISTSSPSGASAGIGFAVPSHLFTRVYNQILNSGKVSRGYVGVSMNRYPLTPEMASFFGVKQGSGVLITQLADGEGNPSEAGPAAKAGLKPEDVIVGFNGKKITNSQDFRLAVAETPPGQKARVKAVRHGKEMDFELVVGERLLENQDKSQYIEPKEEKERTEIGLDIDDVPEQTARALDVSGGAYVLSVKPGSLADDAGLVAEADVIVAANGKPIGSAQALSAFVKGLKSGEPIVLKFVRASRDRRGRLQPEISYTSIVKP